MTQFIELLLNPVTIIATFLALFFVLMAVRRSRHAARPSSHPKDEGLDKPYRIANPYVLSPPPAAPAPPTPSLDDTLTAPKPPAPARRVFRQFNQSVLNPDMNPSSDQTGYVWE